MSVSAGLRHSVALTTAGNVYCWGHGKKGQCGFVGILHLYHKSANLQRVSLFRASEHFGCKLKSDNIHI